MLLLSGWGIVTGMPKNIKKMSKAENFLLIKFLKEENLKKSHEKFYFKFLGNFFRHILKLRKKKCIQTFINLCLVVNVKQKANY